MTRRGIIAACTVLTLALSWGRAYAQETHKVWTCYGNEGSWQMPQPLAHFDAGYWPTWADCLAWRNGDPGAEYTWSYGLTGTPTTTTDAATTSTTTTTTSTVPDTTTTTSTSSSTTTSTAETTTTVAATTTTTQPPSPQNSTTSSTTSTSLPAASTTAPTTVATTTSSTSLPGLPSTTTTLVKTPQITAHGVKPRKGFGSGTTPATPTTITVTVLLTSPISPVGQILRRRTR